MLLIYHLLIIIIIIASNVCILSVLSVSNVQDIKYYVIKGKLGLLHNQMSPEELSNKMKLPLYQH